MAINRSSSALNPALPRPSLPASRATVLRAILTLRHCWRLLGRTRAATCRRHPSAVQPPWPLSGTDRAGVAIVSGGIRPRSGCPRHRKRSSASGSTSSGSPRRSARCPARRQRPDRIEPVGRAPRARDARQFRAQGLRAGRGDRSGRRLVADPPAARSRRDPRRTGMPGPLASRRSLGGRGHRRRLRTIRRSIARLFSGASSFSQHRALFDLLEARASGTGRLLGPFLRKAQSRQSYPQDF